MNSFQFITIITLISYTFIPVADCSEVKQLFDGGNAMTLTEFPWHLGLFEKPYRKLFCGGTILTENYALTSGRCVSQWISENETSVPIDPPKIRLIAGDHNRMDDEEWEQMRDVVEIIIHPLFKYDARYKGKESEGPKGFQNDLAILKVAPSFNFSEGVQPISVISDFRNYITGFEIAGWGITEKRQNTIPTGSYRKKVEIPFNGQQNNETKKKYGFTLKQGTNLLDFNTGIGMNTGLMGRCIGDCGGSIVCREQGPQSSPVLCGIISFGIWCDRYMGSGQSILFNEAEIDWIESIIHPKVWLYLTISGSFGILIIIVGVVAKIIVEKRRQTRTYKV